MALPRYVSTNRPTTGSRGLTLLGTPKSQIQQNAGQVAQLTSRTSQAVGNLVNQYIADAEAIKYANTITGISQGLAEVNAKYQNPNEYLEGANKYVKGYTSNLDESEAARIQATVGKSINSTYVRKHASYTAAQDKKAEESLEAAKTVLINIYKGLPTATEEDLQQREVVLTKLYSTLQLQKQQELRNVTDPEIARAIEIKYAGEREGIVQDARLAKLISYAQTQRDPYSIVMDLMQGTSELTGFENLKPETLRKALHTIKQFGDANVQAEAEENRALKQRKDAVLLQYSQAYEDPNTTDAQRDQIEGKALSLATTAEDYENIDKIVNAWKKRLNASDPEVVNKVDRLILQGGYEEAERLMDDELGDGINIDDVKRRNSGIESARKSLRNTKYMNSTFMIALENEAPTKEPSLMAQLISDDIGKQPNAARNKELHLEYVGIMEEKINSGEVTNSAQLTDAGNKVLAELRKRVETLDAAVAKSPKVLFYINKFPTIKEFIKARRNGEIDATPDEQEEIAKHYYEGGK